MNAKVPLKILTPEGSGQALHPDVLFIKEGFLNYQYWMACTPYPYGNDFYENPILRVSRNGHDWLLFPGAPDPLVTTESKDFHNADTDLFFLNGTLYVFYMTASRAHGSVKFSYLKTSDGVNWDKPVNVFSGKWAVSPSVSSMKNGFYMWHIERDPNIRPNVSTLYRRESNDLSQWSEKVRCQITIPDYVVWHIDVVENNKIYEALVAAYPVHLDPSVCRLFYFFSEDGLIFENKIDRVFIGPSILGWDNRMIYRSTFIKNHDGNMIIWYSAASWSFKTGIGCLSYKDGKFTDLSQESVNLKISKIWGDCVGLMRYFYRRLLNLDLF